MPTYEYRCGACKNEFEAVQTIHQKPRKKCPKCKKLKLYKLVSTGVHVVFKGSGWTPTYH
jgi:putative FmdB family regulatory protein